MLHLGTHLLCCSILHPLRNTKMAAYEIKCVRKNEDNANFLKLMLETSIIYVNLLHPPLQKYNGNLLEH